MHITRQPRGLHRRRPQGSATALVAVFVLLGLLMVAVAAVATGTAARRTGTLQATRSFQQVAAVVAGSVVAPLLTPQLVSGGAGADALNRAVDRARATGPVLAVTVRDDRGHVIWSDEGATDRPLQPHQRTALGSAAPVVDPATSGGSSQQPLTASAGVQDNTGEPLVVDVTGRRQDVAAGARSAWISFAPVTLGAVLLLELLQLPLMLRLARPARRQQGAESAVREAAEAATDVERRRIAREVHDDILPLLHALAYELDSARLSAAHSNGDAVLLDRTAEGLRETNRRLRALLLDLSQDRMPEAGLSAALAGAAERTEAAGVRVRMHAPDIDRVSGPAAQVLYRCAQEALRNVAAHSGAEEVEIAVAVDGPDVTMTIDDDGRGFERGRLAESAAAGHLGLRTVGDLVADSGGSLTATSSPGQGTRIVVRMPLDELGDDMRVRL